MEQLHAHEMRIASLEGRMTEMQVSMARVEGSLKLNNQMTEDIKNTLHRMQRDSSDMVDLTKGMKVLGRVAVWGGGFLALAAGFTTVALFVDARRDSTAQYERLYQQQESKK